MAQRYDRDIEPSLAWLLYLRLATRRARRAARQGPAIDAKAGAGHQSASEAYGQLQIVATRTYERRSVPIPRSLIDELAEHIAGRGPDEFVWQSPEGGPFRYSNWFKRHFRPAVERAAIPAETRFHDLRHSYVAMLIAHGAHPRAIMERMGHSTITVTLDNYGHLFPKLDEALDDALDGMYQESQPKSRASVERLTS